MKHLRTSRSDRLTLRLLGGDHVDVKRFRTSCSHGRRAFTLIEVLLALGIMSVLAVALFSSLHVAFKSRDNTEATLAPVREGEALMELLRGEFESALPPRGKLVGLFTGADWRGEGGRDEDTVEFYASGEPPRDSVGVGEIRKVELRLMNDPTTGQRVLAKRVTSNLLAPTLRLPEDEILCRGVASFDVIYYDGTTWWSSWDSDYERDALPLAVQVTLELDPPANRRNRSDVRHARLARVIQLPCNGEADPSDEAAATSADGTAESDAAAAAPEAGGGQ